MLCGFAACHNNRKKVEDSTLVIQTIDEKNDELNVFLNQMENEKWNIDKVGFSVMYKDLHYQLKESGEYDSESWRPASISITVACNYKLAVDEEWYKSCADTDVKTLNIAFFNEYSSELSDEHFTALGITEALYFSYVHNDETLTEAISDFYEDYNVLKKLVELSYVKGIYIKYSYSMPGGYFYE